MARSAAVALSPWHVQVVAVAGATPSAEAGTSGRDARALARVNRASVVAWLVEGPGTRTLVVYDATVDEVISRAVAPGPLDEPTAAAIALSIKTMLRASEVAPRPEDTPGATAASEPASPSLWLEGDAAARLRASNGTRADPRVGLGLAWWPRTLGSRLGLALRLEEGTGLPVGSRELQGRLGDHAASIAVRGRFRLSDRLSLEPSVGGALHLTLLDGATVDGRPVTDLARVDPVLETYLQLTADLGHSFRLGVRGGAAFWGRWQEYDIDNRAALTLSPVQLSLAVVVGAALDR
jgi:hypothetical protein